MVTNANGTITQTGFVYDGKARRRIRTEASWQSGAWVTNQTFRYIYDGQRVIQERDANNTVLVTYTRGLDLSQSLDGAGGIGGLLARTHPGNKHFYYHADANGNVTAIVNQNQTLVAQYRYDPFGGLVSQSGPLAELNLYRFSSKEYHPPSGLYYYGYRFYDPNLQRWLNRDPSGTKDGPNLFAFCHNGPINGFDAWGLDFAAVTDPYAAARYGLPYIPSFVGNELVRLKIGTLGQVLYGIIWTDGSWTKGNIIGLPDEYDRATTVVHSIAEAEIIHDTEVKALADRCSDGGINDTTEACFNVVIFGYGGFQLGEAAIAAIYRQAAIKAASKLVNSIVENISTTAPENKSIYSTMADYAAQLMAGDGAGVRKAMQELSQQPGGKEALVNMSRLFSGLRQNANTPSSNDVMQQLANWSGFWGQ